ncbi:M20/M25/M40 family metallo-hydrolase [Pelomonas sp. SE-A7]|uniref:M28 family metallopeptidase n=1 Tax=Pelomonas sp. SE-A7 TaxID=3054953 RepID=UPI00259D0BD0|nr:M20/M25/M40 family metallo-hydrolase [Pelomonas sp. SE-A7]MDM4765854.1 M20/M25/M40 family metallo-hydrolase [Pelomonas sp. SE-A7]
MRFLRHWSLLGLTALSLAASAQTSAPWTVKQQWVSAHENFLASDALQGRKSASRDETIAAVYVASQFESFGIKPVPGMKGGYLQTAVIPQPRLEGNAKLTFAGSTEAQGLTLITSNGQPVAGKLVVAASEDPKALGNDEVVLVKGPAPTMGWYSAASRQGVKLLILRESDEVKRLFAQMGGQPRLLRDSGGRTRTTVLAVPGPLFERLASSAGQSVQLEPPPVVEDKVVTTNAIGFLQGSDPKAGVLLFSAHLDHLGMRPDGTIMYGANDNASGVTAVLELARAFAAGTQPKRSILFVCYGAEEIGLYGARYFAENPPIPLKDIVANLEFEMIGAQDPKLPPRTLMMTGFERSDFGETLKARGFQITADPYPEQNFFQRSDNYQLALMGIVAHTVSGWATNPTYHQASDDIAHLDIPFMTAAIQSLIEPARWLANSDYVPAWKPGGKPTR